MRIIRFKCTFILLAFISCLAGCSGGFKEKLIKDEIIKDMGIKGALTEQKLLSINKFCLEEYSECESLEDISKLKNIDRLTLGYRSDKFKPEIISVSSVESADIIASKNKMYENDLKIIMDSCNKIECFEIIPSDNSIHFESLEFLAGTADSLEYLHLYYMDVDDYSYIYECANLQELVIYYNQNFDDEDLVGIDQLEHCEAILLQGTNVSKADQFLEMKNLKTLCIENTPLAENEEELDRIREKFPDIVIRRNNDDYQITKLIYDPKDLVVLEYVPKQDK